MILLLDVGWLPSIAGKTSSRWEILAGWGGRAGCEPDIMSMEEDHSLPPARPHGSVELRHP